jgi:hypothetical protein
MAAHSSDHLAVELEDGPAKWKRGQTFAASGMTITFKVSS